MEEILNIFQKIHIFPVRWRRHIFVEYRVRAFMPARSIDEIVVTDWGGSNDHVKGVAAGSNLEMPSCGYDSAREVIAAVRNGKLKEYE